MQLRHRVESIIAFSDGFVVGAQKDQLRRYNEIKQTEMPMAEAAKKTREFRCPPHEQVRALPPPARRTNRCVLHLPAARTGACFIPAHRTSRWRRIIIPLNYWQFRI